MKKIGERSIILVVENGGKGKWLRFVLLHEACVDSYCSEEDMYRDAEEIERERVSRTSSSGMFKLLVFQIQNYNSVC